MPRTKNWIVFTAGAAASVFLALFASSPIAAADSTAPPGPAGPGTPAEQSKSASVPESLKTTAMYMKAIPATPALVLQSSSAFVTSAVATPAEILTASAAALGAFGVR
jgi:hypothetical protein